jgi:hypothetical protein
MALRTDVLFNLLHGRKTMTCQPGRKPVEERECARSEVRRIWWPGDGCNLILSQEVLHCEGGLTGCIGMVQDLIAFPRPNAAY